MPLHTDPTIEQILSLSDSGSAEDALDIEPVHVGDKLTSSAGDWAKLRLWTQNTYESLIDDTRARANTQIKNLALWTGLHYSSQNVNGDFRDSNDDDITLETHKVIVNNIYDIERNRYSKISRNQPQTRVVPMSTDYDDFVGAKIGDGVLKTAKRRVKQRQKVNQMLRESFVFGESWIKTHWNKDKGEVDPRWEREAAKLKPGQKKTVKIDGESVIIDSADPMFVGDHDLEVRLPWTIFTDPKPTPEQTEWVIFVDHIHVETAKKLWPKKSRQIVAGSEGYRTLNAGTLLVENLRNHIQVFTVYTRSGKFMPYGHRWVCTESVMLEAPEDNPCERCDESEWGNLPIERLTDIDVPGRLHGYSTIQILSNLQHSENQMTTMMKHYLLLFGHPTMLLPAEAKISYEELSDGSMALTYFGATPPSLMVPNPIPPQVVAFAEYLRERMQKLGDLHGVSSGDLPQNVRAARAIRLLQELEDLRATSIFAKYNDLYLSLDRKLLLQTKNYQKSDGRLIQIFGKANEFLVEDFDVDVLSKDFQVDLEITGMLPQQPSARAEFISDMYQATQGALFSQEKWVKLLGFENEQEFLDHSTVSVIKAQRENDLLCKGKKCPIPEPHEDHVVEIREHLTLLHSATYSAMNKNNQEALKDHVRTHEYLLFLKMQDAPMLREYMLTQMWYPAVFKLPRDTMAQMGSPGTVQGAPQGQGQAPVMAQGESGSQGEAPTEMMQ